MKTASVDRDERTIAVENASYRWAYLFLSFGLLAVVAIRSFALNQSSWDLLALVVLSGAVTALFRRRQQAMPGSDMKAGVVAALAGLVVATALAYGSMTVNAMRAGYRAAQQQAVDSSR